MSNEITALALEIYEGKKTYFTNAKKEKVDANETLRGMIMEQCGGKWNHRSFDLVKHTFFDLIEEIVTVRGSELTRDLFSNIMTFKDVSPGQKPQFRVTNPDLFEVSVVANGTMNFNRQRLFDSVVNTTAFDLGVAIYDDWDSFMLGLIDFNEAVDKVIKSFNHKIAELIGKTFTEAYNTLKNGQFHEVGQLDETKLLELVEKVGNGAVIYGSKLALSKIPGIQGFVTDATDIRNGGYLRMFKGVKCVELENSYNKEKEKFVIPDNILYIIPEGEHVLYGGFEGDAFVYDRTNITERMDKQLEFFYTRRFHLGVAVANRFGGYEITA
ncbi:hypothetical protein [Peptostreptococcus faecalis]|uniref:hypothetical protein n=1 Tax=Peptostreptococcus faecalis TaxID=2045015 RepID=UPI000C7B7AF7|nr:hypothetical protein [Peptostreptococcus faecalis]